MDSCSCNVRAAIYYSKKAPIAGPSLLLLASTQSFKISRVSYFLELGLQFSIGERERERDRGFGLWATGMPLNPNYDFRVRRCVRGVTNLKFCLHTNIRIDVHVRT